MVSLEPHLETTPFYNDWAEFPTTPQLQHAEREYRKAFYESARIAKLLRNPVYRGAIAWNRHTMGSLFELDGEGKLKAKKQKGWRRNRVEDWIITEDVHEPLVDRKTWDAAQKAVAKRRAEAGKSRPTNRSLLSSLMVCKRCGHRFTSNRDRRWPGPTGDGYRYYTCTGYHRYG